MDKGMRAVVRCFDGIQEELCAFRESIEEIYADLSDVEFIHVGQVVEDCESECEDECCYCEDCFEL